MPRSFRRVLLQAVILLVALAAFSVAPNSVSLQLTGSGGLPVVKPPSSMTQYCPKNLSSATHQVHKALKTSSGTEIGKVTVIDTPMTKNGTTLECARVFTDQIHLPAGTYWVQTCIQVLGASPSQTVFCSKPVKQHSKRSTKFKAKVYKLGFTECACWVSGWVTVWGSKKASSVPGTVTAGGTGAPPAAGSGGTGTPPPVNGSFSGPSLSGSVVGCTSGNANGCNPGATWWKQGGIPIWGSAAGAGMAMVDLSTNQQIGVYIDDTVPCSTAQSLVAPSTDPPTCVQEWVTYYATLSPRPPLIYAATWWDDAQPFIGATATLGEMYTQPLPSPCTSSCGTFPCNASSSYGYIVQRYLDYINQTDQSSVWYPTGAQYGWFYDLWATAAGCVRNSGPIAWY